MICSSILQMQKMKRLRFMTITCCNRKIISFRCAWKKNMFTRHAIMIAHVFPPKESCRIRVSLLSLYGTLGSLEFKALITLDNAKRDWLILELSTSLTPSLPVFLLSSFPVAKHHKPRSHFWPSRIARGMYKKRTNLIFFI